MEPMMEPFMIVASKIVCWNLKAHLRPHPFVQKLRECAFTKTRSSKVNDMFYVLCLKQADFHHKEDAIQLSYRELEVITSHYIS
jgi:hypothetical protein